MILQTDFSTSSPGNWNPMEYLSDAHVQVAWSANLRGKDQNWASKLLGIFEGSLSVLNRYRACRFFRSISILTAFLIRSIETFSNSAALSHTQMCLIEFSNTLIQCELSLCIRLVLLFHQSESTNSCWDLSFQFNSLYTTLVHQLSMLDWASVRCYACYHWLKIRCSDLRNSYRAVFFSIIEFHGVGSRLTPYFLQEAKTFNMSIL